MKYLSKLLSMLLVGSMLWTVGCVKDDIRDLNKKINNVQTSMDEQFAEVEKNLGTTQEDLAKLTADVEANKSDLDKLTTAFNEYKTTAKSDLDAAKAEFAKAVEDLKTMDDAIKTKLVEACGDLDKLEALVDEKVKEFEKRIADAEALLAEIQGEIDALSEQLASLIQNITFIPEYTDGLATAVRVVGPKATSLTATTLTAVFEVTPASAANLIAEYGCVAIEPLKTRAEVLKGDRLVIEPIAEQPGRVKVTAFVHNMPADFNSYAFTLNVEVEGNAVASSDYVYIHENAEAEYQYALVREEDNESIEKHPNWNTDRGALEFETKWTKAAEEPINTLEGYVYKLTDGKEKFYTLAEVEKKYGMSENALAVTLNCEMSDAHKEFATATADATIDMLYDNEYQMYQFINAEAEIKFSADNAAFLNDTFTVYYKIGGADVKEGTFTIEEEGDLYWLSQNQDYVFGEKAATKVVFAENVELDMANYCNAEYKNAPYKAISPATLVEIEGNGAKVANLDVTGVESVGLFGEVRGSVQNLTVVNSKMTGNHWVGGIVGIIWGDIKNCHVDGLEITATPCKNADGAFDDGDKVGGIVGYSAPDTEDGPSYSIENCSAKNSKITAFRDVAGIVGAMNYGDNLKNNSVENITVVAEQRQSQAPGYVKDANLGRILGRDVLGAWKEAEVMPGANQYGDVDLRIRYAIGAEVNVDSFDATKHALEISTANGLAWFSQNVLNADYYTFDKVVLVSDIDFENKIEFADDKVEFVGITNGSIDAGWRSINFDGQDYTIRNFKWDANKKNIALFGVYNGDIKNIKMENVELKGLGRVAPIAAQCWGHIDNCHVNNLKISVYQNAEDGDKLGGIVAQMQADSDSGATNNLITNCSVSNAEIEGYRDLGALAGHAELKEYDNSNKFENVTIWVNQLFENYEPGHYPFKNEHEVVGRIDFEANKHQYTQKDVEGVDIYNILYADLGRRYVVTPEGQLCLGYAKCDAKENAAALLKFAEEYKKYDNVFQAAEITLEGQWAPIGDSYANAFRGTYNGNNQNINGLMITDKEASPSGLFGFVVGAVKNVKIIKPMIYGSHWAGAIAGQMFGSVTNCQVIGGEIILMPTYTGTRWDDGDKAGALVGYLAASGNGEDKVEFNHVENVRVKAYRDVAALVGCANNIDSMTGNTVKGCSIVVDQITGSYPDTDPKNPNVGMLVGDLRAENEEVLANSLANISNNVISNSTLGQIVEKEGQMVTETIDTIEVGSVRE